MGLRTKRDVYLAMKILDCTCDLVSSIFQATIAYASVLSPSPGFQFDPCVIFLTHLPALTFADSSLPCFAREVRGCHRESGRRGGVMARVAGTWPQEAGRTVLPLAPAAPVGSRLSTFLLQRAPLGSRLRFVLSRRNLACIKSLCYVPMRFLLALDLDDPLSFHPC